MLLTVKLENKHEMMLQRLMSATGKNKSDVLREALECLYDVTTNPERAGYNDIHKSLLALLQIICRVDCRLHIDTTYKMSGKSVDFDTLILKIKEASEKLYNDILSNE